MNKSASEPIKASELNSFLEEIFNKFDNEEMGRDEYVFLTAWREDNHFRETVEGIAIDIVEENESENSTRQEQNTFFRKYLVLYFEYRVLFLELLRINSEEDRKDASIYIWKKEFNEDIPDDIIASALYFHQACEALCYIFKELLMEFFNEGHGRNYLQQRLGLLTVYYRVGIQSVIDEKNGKKCYLSDLNEILKKSSEREKKQFIENCSLLQTLSLVDDFRKLCTNLN